LNKICKKLFVCVNYVIFLFDKHICIAIYEKITIISIFWGRRFGGAGVGAWTQFPGRACRRSQNGPAGAPAGYKFRGANGDVLIVPLKN
jgi:hypothetical protein